MTEITEHIAYWGEDNAITGLKRAPSREDALILLSLCLNLLAEALPLAIKEVGKADILKQYWFWCSFGRFNDETDLFDGDVEGISLILDEWASRAINVAEDTNQS